MSCPHGHDGDCLSCAEEAWVAQHGPAPAGKGWSWSGRDQTFLLVNMPGFPVPDTLLGIPDFDDFESQAETGQGPPA